MSVEIIPAMTMISIVVLMAAAAAAIKCGII
jgi:hypothetical protein